MIKEFLFKEKIYQKDVLVGKQYEIGDYTTGGVRVLNWNDTDEVKLKIGKFCSIAENVTIFLGGNHRKDWITTYPFPKRFPDWDEAKNIKNVTTSKGNVEIGNDVWIGKGVTILSGTKIGNGVIIATEAVVTKNIPDYAIVAGNPARIKKYRFSKGTIDKLLKIAWWDWDLQKIKENVKLLCSDKLDNLNVG